MHIEIPDIYSHISPTYHDLLYNRSRHLSLKGGRGSGKSHFVVIKLLFRILTERNHKVLVVRQTYNSHRDSTYALIKSYLEKWNLLQIAHCTTNPLRISLPDFGSEFIFKGLDDAEKTKGLDCSIIWFEECHEVKQEEDYDEVNQNLRIESDYKQTISSFNPINRKHWLKSKFFDNTPSNVTVHHSTWRDNIFLDDDLISDIVNSRRAKVNDLGLWGGDIEGALWNETLIDPYRIFQIPDNLQRIVVAIDPSVTNKSSSDECGIIVAGKDHAGKGYLLEDISGKYSPNEWANKAINAYQKYSADRIVAETNNGGDLVETVIRSINPSVSFKKVHASRGKVTRAEPVVSLYERGLIHHCGRFFDLETQMCEYVPASNDSPDRMDAMVWAFTDLMIQKKEFVLV